MTQAEAFSAMRMMLSGDAAPEAIGAVLMLLRMKGETAAEIAGFADAAAQAVPELPSVDLDWPSYAAGRTRGQPWFLLSAKLVAQAGHRVLIHGWNGQDEKVRGGLVQAGIGVARTPEDAAQLLERDRIAYMPLEYMHPALFGLLNLRDALGLRSYINTVCRMLNPSRARASVQGVFHPSYRLLQADAAALLDWEALSVIKGGGGEFERNPAKDLAVFGLREGVLWEDTRRALRHDTVRLAQGSDLDLRQLTHGASPPEAVTDIVIGTAALALETLGQNAALSAAETLWSDRLARCAA
jgi:anthranilate phosphoribosyltransferase